MKYLLPLLLLLAFSCKKKAEVYDASLQTGPILAFEDIETIYSDAGDSKLALRAPIQLRKQNGDEIFPKGMTIDIYDEQGRKKTEVKADSGQFLSDHGLYMMIGNVHVNNVQQQQRLETPLLYWDERFKEIYTDTVLKITTTTEIIHGVGLRAKQDFSQYKIGRPTGVIKLSEGQMGNSPAETPSP